MAIRRPSVSLLSACSVLLVLVAFSPPANAAQGDLDPSFGVGGKVVSNFGAGLDAASAVAVQPDGKIVIAGSAFNGDFLVARYVPDGILDPSFGTGGLVTTDFGGSDGAVAISVRSDGKLLVGGATSLPGDSMTFAAARYAADGSLDPTFGIGGKTTAPYGGGTISMTIEADGSFDLAGSVFNADADFLVARYGPDGAPDTSFGGGLVTSDFGAWDTAWAIAAQPDGKILVGGNTGNGAEIGQFALARYDPDGGLDATFGTSGLVTTDFSALDDSISAVVVRSDERIIAVGSTFTGTTRDLALAQYEMDGSLDTAFGSSGKVTTDLGGQDRPLSAVVQSDGSVVVGGTIGVSPTTYEFAIARYTPDGTIDPSFGSMGSVVTDFPGTDDEIFSLALQPDGNVVAAGATFTGIDGDVAIARYLGGPEQADALELSVYWGPAHSRTLAYRNGGSLTAGDYEVDPATGRPMVIHGVGTIPSTVSGDATVTFDIAFNGTTKKWSGTVLVNDPGAGFSAIVPIHSWRFGVTRDGTTTRGVLWGFKAQSVPRKCFMFVFEIDDLE